MAAGPGWLAFRSPAPVDGTTSKVFDNVDGADYHNTSYTGVGSPVGFFADPQYARERRLATECNTKDGVKTMTDEELAAERAMDWELLKKFSKRILQMDLSSFSFPVGYSEPRSFLERSCDLFSFLASRYVRECIDASIPERKLALLGVGIIAGFHLYLASKKPWNPVLGETYVSSWDGEVAVYAEQISHHPPRSAYQLVGPGWRIDAVFAFTISSGLRVVEVYQKGNVTLRTDEDDWYEWQFPAIAVTGIIKGDRHVKVKDGFTVKDRVRDLELKIDVDPPRKGRWSRLPGGASVIAGGVLPSFDPEVTGDYCSRVMIGSELAWDIQRDFTVRVQSDVLPAELLPSDSRFRLDRAFLIGERMDAADKAKVMIEEMQRREEKLRK